MLAAPAAAPGRREEARPRVLFVLVSLMIIIAVTSLAAQLFYLLLFTALLAAAHPRRLWLRCLPLAGMALLLWLTQAVWYGGTVWWRISWGGHEVVLYREGMRHGLLLAVRLAAAGVALLYLSVSTELAALLAAARWLRLPPALLEIAVIAYRYVDVLGEELRRERQAQRMRLWRQDWRGRWQSLGLWVGTAVLRAFDRSTALHRAMLCRGYHGEVAVLSAAAVPVRGRQWSGYAAATLVALALAWLFPI